MIEHVQIKKKRSVYSPYCRYFVSICFKSAGMIQYDAFFPIRLVVLNPAGLKGLPLQILVGCLVTKGEQQLFSLGIPSPCENGNGT